MSKHKLSEIVDYQPELSLDEYIPYALVKTQNWMHQILKPESSSSVLNVTKISRTESRVIVLIAMSNAATPSELGNTLGVDPAVVTRALSSLTKKNLVASRPNASDSRSKSMYLTPLGAELCDELFANFASFNEHLKSVLTEAEKKLLLKLLDKLLIGSRLFAG